MDGRIPDAASAADDVVRLDAGMPLDERRWGGKAAGLARLVAAGFHVPPGLCVSGELFRRHLARALDADRASLAFGLDRSGRIDPARLELAAVLSFYAAEVAFSALLDQKEQETFLNFPTSFDLSEEQIDRLREVAARLLYQSEDFRRLVQDLGGKLPSFLLAPVSSAPSR